MVFIVYDKDCLSQITKLIPNKTDKYQSEGILSSLSTLDPSGTWQLAAKYEKLIEQSPPMTVLQAIIESWILQL